MEVIVRTPKYNDNGVKDITLIIVQSRYRDPNLCCYFLEYLSAYQPECSGELAKFIEYCRNRAHWSPEYS